MTFHPDNNLPDCMLPDGGDCCGGYQALLADWRRLRAVAATASDAAIANAIREYFKSIGNSAVVSSDGIERVYYSGFSLTKLAEAIARSMSVGLAQPSWQPIETAPHATSVILGWWYDGVWMTQVGAATHGWRRGAHSTMSQHGQATHWMPQPVPPVSSTQAQTP